MYNNKYWRQCNTTSRSYVQPKVKHDACELGGKLHTFLTLALSVSEW